MKIIFTVHTYYPNKDGVQFVTEYLAEGLVKKGHDVLVVTRTLPNVVESETYHGVKIRRVPVYTKYAIYHGDKKKYQDYIIDLCKNADTIVNVCTQNALTDYLLPVLDKIDCRKILHLHGIYDSHWKKSDFASIKSFAYKIWRNIRWGYLYRTTDFSKYNTVLQLHQFDYGYQYFEKKYGIRSTVLENAADSRFSVETPAREGDKYCVCVANFTPRKNQGRIIEAFYKASVPGVELHLIGSSRTKYAETLEKIIGDYDKKYGTHNVRFIYGQSRKETISEVRNASLYLLGSTWEAFSISLIESMASSVPFISTDVGVARFLPGGTVVRDADEMAYWIRLLFENENIRSDMGLAGHQYYSDHLTIEDKVSELEAVLEGEK